MMKTFLVLIGIAGLWQEAYAGVFGSKYYMREHGLKWSGWCVEYDGEDGVYQCSMTMKDDDQEILVQYDAELISSGDFIHIERSGSDDGVNCKYDGTIVRNADGAMEFASGTYTCNSLPIVYEWSALINVDEGSDGLEDPVEL